VNLQTINELEQAAKNVMAGYSDGIGPDYMEDIVAVCALAKKNLPSVPAQRSPDPLICDHPNRTDYGRYEQCKDCGAQFDK
jgi:hypothetical protein